MEDCYLYDRPTTIGLMTRKDIPEVLEIERQSFSIPWTENNFTDALKSSTCMGLVCRRGDCVGGFAVYELRKESIEIMNFAVLNDLEMHIDPRKCLLHDPRARQGHLKRADAASGRVTRLELP